MDTLCSLNHEGAIASLKTIMRKWKDNQFNFDDTSPEWIKDFVSFLVSCPAEGEDCLLLMEVAKFMSRDKKFVAVLMEDDTLMQRIIDIAKLNDSTDYSCLTTISPEQIEAQKCLCNFSFQSVLAIQAVRNFGVLERCLERVKCYEAVMGIDCECLDLDIRLLFVLTALCPELRLDAYKLGLMEIIIDLLNFTANKDRHCVGDLKRCAELLKLGFNLVDPLKSDPASQHKYDCIATVCHRLLVIVRGNAIDDGGCFVNDCMNMITTFPPQAVDLLVQLSSEANHENLVSLDSALTCFESKYDETNESSSLHPVLVTLIKMSKNATARKYLRQKILPPLRNEVQERPECGASLRNKFVRLMQAVSDVNVLSAELLFQICKRNVDRLVKYTGYGNAAGLLFRYGLMAGGGQSHAEDMSPDEDSDTEEYKQCRQSIDPVVGSVVPDRPSPFEGMTEEQKEYEAMKLVDQMHKMMQKGVIKPATVGPDGKVVPVEHMLQLQEQYNKDEGINDSDSD